MAGGRRKSRSSRSSSRKSGSPYFFRRVWSPFGAGVNMVGKATNVGLGFVDNTAHGGINLVRRTTRGAVGAVGNIGYGVASSANDAIGGLVGSNGRRSSTRRRHAKRSTRRRR